MILVACGCNVQAQRSNDQYREFAKSTKRSIFFGAPCGCRVISQESCGQTAYSAADALHNSTAPPNFGANPAVGSFPSSALDAQFTALPVRGPGFRAVGKMHIEVGFTLMEA